MATVLIPSVLRSFTGGQSEVRVPGNTVGEVLHALSRNFPELGARVFDERGNVRRYVNVFHNDEDIRFLKALDTPATDSDRITLIPAIAGGM
ncbi:MAG: MoaD/ThiS family protein [Myxococcaceae bacterium]|nr:MoaD/ThiS family protein [Myxococcaceae bacterium]MCI0671352.1 MoaD/ThiS family protein [Myxococcaceae bacterium]